ncbi:phage head closure protein [Anaerotignum sp. MB30-C6]|uniref:phage head closure protein n=1 Tax=Anaerotignum sp. MB30-C6 TaxID=3070814 RepID=UPI0027DC2C69|nr:phage head closure protein [Anaerotignum sp. MB30-C6]WMI81594.1 phage head closure protein [Anaerotignum sp. MB30-C6]
MNPGELRHRVIIQRLKKVAGPNLAIKTEYQDVKTVWAKVNNLHGKEYWTAKEYAAENTVEFIVRYSSVKNIPVNDKPDSGKREISVKDRLVFRGQIYNITSIDNILYRNEYVKIKAVALELGEKI